MACYFVRIPSPQMQRLDLALSHRHAMLAELPMVGYACQQRCRNLEDGNSRRERALRAAIATTVTLDEGICGDRSERKAPGRRRTRRPSWRFELSRTPGPGVSSKAGSVPFVGRSSSHRRRSLSRRRTISSARSTTSCTRSPARSGRDPIAGSKRSKPTSTASAASKTISTESSFSAENSTSCPPYIAPLHLWRNRKDHP